MAVKPLSKDTSGLLSQQVSGSRYFFLNLAPAPGSRFVPALGGREHCNPDYLIDRDSFTYSAIEYVAEGRGWAVLDGVRSELRPGSVFAYGQKTRSVIGTAREDPMVKYFLCLAGTEADERLTVTGVRPAQVRNVANHGEIRAVFEDLIREGQHSSVRAPRICEVLVELLLLKIADAGAEGLRKDDLAWDNFLRCKSLIDVQAERFGSLQDIATAAGLEASSICRLFRRYQGISPYQYLLRRKMNLAAEFLVETGGMVKEAAQRVGFADPYHFSRCFKALHGVAPSELRRHR